LNPNLKHSPVNTESTIRVVGHIIVPSVKVVKYAVVDALAVLTINMKDQFKPKKTNKYEIHQ
jgi:hypothetical protein